MFENSVYPGIADLLQALHNSGRRLAVATSKPIMYARQIVEHFGLADYFLAVCGPELDGVGAVKTTRRRRRDDRASGWCERRRRPHR